MNAGRRTALLLLGSAGVGGVERHLQTLLPGLEARGWSVGVVSLSPPAADGPLGSTPRLLPVGRTGPGPVQRLRQLRALQRRILVDDPDVVIGVGPTPNVLASLARRRNGPPLVLLEVGNVDIPRRRWWNRTSMWAYRRADVLVVQTDRAADRFRSLRRRPPEVVVVANPLADAIPRVDPGAPRAPVIAGAGRLVPSKRYADLLRAVALLGERARDWRILIVGDGPERPALERLAADLGLADRTTFTGVHPAPWTLLADAAVFVLCSEHEGMPNVLLEAAASGCALVAADCEYGPRDLFEDGVGIALYPPGDVDALACELGGLLADRPHRVRLAGAAAATLDRHRPDRVADAFGAVLDRVTAGRPVGQSGSGPAQT